MVQEHVVQDLAAAVELSAENAMASVGLAKGAPAVLDVGTEKARGELELALGKRERIDRAKHEADHRVFDDAPDEVVDDVAEPDHAADAPDRRGLFGDEAHEQSLR